MSELTERIRRLSAEQQSALLERLAGAAGDQSPAAAVTAAATGPVPLLPAQRILLDQLTKYGADIDKYPVTSCVQAPGPMRAALTERALRHVMAHHDATGLRCVRTGSGWEQTLTGLADPVPFQVTDLSDSGDARRRAALAETAAELRDGISLARGPVLRLAQFDLGQEEPARLLLVIHHLVADAYSVSVLWDDLLRAYQQLSRGVTVELRKTTPFATWARVLHDYAASPALEHDARYWYGPRWDGVAALPAAPDAPVAGGAPAAVRASLPGPEVDALLRALPSGAQLPDAVLAALVMALGRWTGAGTFGPVVVRHGRAQALGGADLSRTVGWLTVHPHVLFDLAGAATFADSVRAVASQLRQVPFDGIPWEWIPTQLRPDWLGRLQQASLAFDYLGGGSALPAGLRPAPEDADGSLGTPQIWGGRTLLVGAQVVGGELSVKLSYDRQAYPPERIEAVAADLLAFLRAGAAP
jgi:hypothetical protein